MLATERFICVSNNETVMERANKVMARNEKNSKKCVIKTIIANFKQDNCKREGMKMKKVIQNKKQIFKKEQIERQGQYFVPNSNAYGDISQRKSIPQSPAT